MAGQSSPSPDYPQSIQVVTGENSVVIKNSDNSQSQTFTLNLGSLELAKISTYADYLWHDIVTGNWYKHSEIKKVLASDYSWNFSSTALQGYVAISDLLAYQTTAGYCNIATIGNVNSPNKFYVSTDKLLVYRNPTYNGEAITTQSAFNNYIKANAIFYLRLAEATETQITDTTLINQLNAIEEASGYTGTTYIISTNTGTDLAIIPSYHYNYVTPAPSPDRASEVQVVKGENSVKIENRNRWDEDWEVGIYSSEGVPQSSSNAIRSKYPIPIEPNTNYYFYKGFDNSGRICWYDENMNFISTSTTTWGTVKTSPNNAHFVNISTAITYGNSYRNDICVNESDNLNGTYTAHQEQNYTITLPTGMELCKIGNYQDYIYKSGDNWYKRAEIGKATDTTGSTSKTITDMVADSGFYSYYGGTLSGQTITYASAIPNTNTIYYPLANPTETKITDTTLVNQLDDIYNKLKTYQGTSHITQTNAKQPFILTLDYKKSNLLRIQALENA